MKNQHLIKQITIGIWMMLAIAVVHAGIPLWTFTPLTPTQITVPANDTATVSYQVTNQSHKLHTLVMRAIPGITQDTTAGHCPNPFILGYQQSCILTLSINGSALNGNVLGGPIVCQHGNPNQCYQPSSTHSLMITRGPAAAYTLGGTVFGLSGTLVLANNSRDALVMNADGTFTFSTPLPPGSPYVVTVQNQPANQTCTVANSTGVISNTNITNITVNCSTNTRTVGGQVSGLAISESLVLQNNSGDNLTVNSDGSFTFMTPVAQGASYNVTVLTQPATQTCTVTNGSGTAGISDITTIQVTCATNAYTVGGIVSGLSGTVVLQNNGIDNQPINSNGPFTFSIPVAQGAPYNVTVETQPASQTCIVINGSGVMGGANITNVSVNCVANTTTLTTSVSELALSVTGITEYGVSGTPSSGLPRIITITNTGSNTAMNLSVNAPIWPEGTTSATTCTNTLAVGSSCSITITPGNTATSDGTNPCSNGTAPVPTIVQITADNANTVASNVVILSYGCIYQGGYVFALDDSTPNTGSVTGKVAATTDQAAAYPNGIVWTSNGGTGGGVNGFNAADVSYDILPGIDETSTSTTGSPAFSTFDSFFQNTYTNQNPFISESFSRCNGLSDGSCNTTNIVTFYNQFITNNTLGSGGDLPFTASAGPTPLAYYAAGLCRQTISGYADWYLPAICEMGYGSSMCGIASAPMLQNMQFSLVDFNNLNLLADSYWSSTEASSDLQSSAWGENFSTNPGGSGQFDFGKANQLGVRCSRVLSP